MATKQQSSKAAQLGAAKLESSGLNPKDATRLGLKLLSADQTSKLHASFRPLCSLKIQYHGPDGRPLTDVPGGKPFYRLRYLELPTDFSSLTEKKAVRYVQEPNTAPVAYFPLNQDWGALLTDPSQPLILTEGELKAVKACQEGFPTLGLGGVYNWRAHKLGIEWLPSLDPIVWLRRNVYICFDSDYLENPMVCAALKELAEALHARGAFAYLVTLPTLDTKDKVGLDDFLVKAGPSANHQFRQLLHDAEPLGLTRSLWGLNDKYVYVENPGLIVNQETRAKVSPAAFKDHLESTLSYQERELKKDGSLSYKAVSASAAWLRWPLRKQVSKLTYAPGQPKLLINSPLMYNLWSGWGVQPAKGDVRPFYELVDHLFTNADPGAKEWFLQWCAYPLQHPGIKMFSSAVLHGVRHGTGKSFIGYTLGKIYGENFAEINQLDLHSHFNEWAEGKQFVMGDDVTGSNKRADADFLKKMISQKSIRINGKYVPSYSVPDCLNYFFTANHPDSFFLEDDDRRYFIQEVQVGPLPEEFYREYELWYDGLGPAHLFEHLLRLDTSGFNPAAPAFKTAAKERMISNVQSDLASWVREMLSSPATVLRVREIPITKDLFTSKELLAIYNPTGSGNLTANGMGRELARAGVHQVCAGRPILAGGKQGRYYVVRNQDKWLKKTPRECAVHIESAESQPQKKY